MKRRVCHESDVLLVWAAHKDKQIIRKNEHGKARSKPSRPTMKRQDVHTEAKQVMQGGWWEKKKRAEG